MKFIYIKNRAYPLYIFLIAETFFWGFALAILKQAFHQNRLYFNLINTPIFGWIMMGAALLAGLNLFLKWNKRFIQNLFLSFRLFQMIFIVLGYLMNHPIDGAWARNFAECLAIAWLLIYKEE